MIAVQAGNPTADNNRWTAARTIVRLPPQTLDAVLHGEGGGHACAVLRPALGTSFTYTRYVTVILSEQDDQDLRRDRRLTHGSAKTL